MAQYTLGKIEEQDQKLDELHQLHTEALFKLNQLMDLLRAAPNNRGAPQVIVTEQPLRPPIPTFEGKYE